MGRTASAVIALIECKKCHGHIALGTCVCIKNKDKNDEKFYHPASAQIRRLGIKQSIEGVAV